MADGLSAGGRPCPTGSRHRIRSLEGLASEPLVGSDHEMIINREGFASWKSIQHLLHRTAYIAASAPSASHTATTIINSRSGWRSFTTEESPARARFPTVNIFQRKTSAAAGACPVTGSCTASSARSGSAREKKDMRAATSAANSPAGISKPFPMTVGKKGMLRAVPYRRKFGTEKWIQDEEARYVCPGCGNKVFRGAVQCNQCKTKLDID